MEDICVVYVSNFDATAISSFFFSDNPNDSASGEFKIDAWMMSFTADTTFNGLSISEESADEEEEEEDEEEDV